MEKKYLVHQTSIKVCFVDKLKQQSTDTEDFMINTKN